MERLLRLLRERDDDHGEDVPEQRDRRGRRPPEGVRGRRQRTNQALLTGILLQYVKSVVCE